MTETTILKQQIANLALELRQIGDSVTAAKLEEILDEYRRNSADARKTRRKKIRCLADSPPDMSAGPSSPSLKERRERKNQREIKRENTPTPNTDDDGDAAADLVSVVRKYASKHSLNAAAVETWLEELEMHEGYLPRGDKATPQNFHRPLLAFVRSFSEQHGQGEAAPDAKSAPEENPVIARVLAKIKES